MPAAYASHGEVTTSCNRSYRMDTCNSVIGALRVGYTAYPYADPKSRTAQPRMSTGKARVPDRQNPEAYPAEARSPRWKCVNGSQTSSSISSMNASTDPDPASNIPTKPIATTSLHEPRMIPPPKRRGRGPGTPSEFVIRDPAI